MTGTTRCASASDLQSKYPAEPRATSLSLTAFVYVRQIALTCMLPKKTNHDLKRDVEKKLQSLEKRTQRAMLELMHAKEGRATPRDTRATGG